MVGSEDRAENAVKPILVSATRASKRLKEKNDRKTAASLLRDDSDNKGRKCALQKMQRSSSMYDVLMSVEYHCDTLITLIK